MSGFADWVCRTSNRTNRSLAGSTLYADEPGDDLLATAQDWGLRMVDSLADADFVYGTTATSTPLDQMEGRQAIEHARLHMGVVHHLATDLRDSGTLHGVRVATCLILEPKTCVFLQELQAAGAQVGIYSGGESADSRVMSELRRSGIVVAADPGWDATARHQAALHLLDEIRPDIIVDDGASFARLACMERPELAAGLVGVAEETTSGVRAFQAMQHASELPFPVIAVNDSPLKTGFDNAHGTGETCVTTMQELLGSDWFEGKNIVVIGYGPVGRGFALRARRLGGRLTICDADPVVALKAVFEGFTAQPLNQTLQQADLVVSATGVRHTLTIEHLRAMQEHATVAVIGGIANEIALDAIPGLSAYPASSLQTLPVPQGPNLTLLSGGDGVNYTSGHGNPIEVMDLSFAVQMQAISYLITHRGSLDNRVLQLGSHADREIANLALQLRGYEACTPVSTNVDWRLTRFEDELASHHGHEARTNDQ